VKILRANKVKRYHGALEPDKEDDPTEFIVSKRYSEFWALYNAIRLVFRGKLPDFPPRTFLGDPLNQEFISQRKEALHNWLKSIVSKNRYWCMPVEEFLGLELVDPPLLKKPKQDQGDVDNEDGMAKKSDALSEEKQEKIEDEIYGL
jgi:hypothetical protein